MKVGERVKYIRKEVLDLTLEKFGERLGVGKTAISNIENGNRSLTDQMAKAICREFDINEEWLRTGKGDMRIEKDRNRTIAEFAADLIKEPESFKIRLIESLSALNQKDWEDIERIFDKLLKG